MCPTQMLSTILINFRKWLRSSNVMIRFSSSQLVTSEYGMLDMPNPTVLDAFNSINAFHIGTESKNKSGSSFFALSSCGIATPSASRFLRKDAVFCDFGFGCLMTASTKSRSFFPFPRQTPAGTLRSCRRSSEFLPGFP